MRTIFLLICLSLLGHHVRSNSLIKRINVTEYGAVTSKDLIPVINKIVSGLTPGNPTEIYIPAGVWKINPSKSNYVLLKSDITVTGDGKATVLKVDNNAGDYGYIFSNNDAPVKNIKFDAFTVDQNTANNKTSNIVVGELFKSQLVFSLSLDFNTIIFNNLFIDNACGVNSISANGIRGRNVTVTNCTIHWTQGRCLNKAGQQQYYDNSAIYMNCVGQKISGNKIYADKISDQATAGIETHNGEAVVNDNTINNYQTGVNIVNESNGKSRAGSDITVTKNTITNAVRAIMLYAITNGKSLNNVNVTDNKISLAQNKWNMEGIGVGVAADLGVDKDQKERLAGLIEDVKISGNEIRFEPDFRKSIPNDYLSAGISLTGNNPVNRCTITNNTIINAPLKAVSITSLNNKTLEAVTVTNNTITDCGANPNITSAKQGYRSAFFIGDNAENIVIEDNNIVDTGKSQKVGGYLYYRSYNKSSNNVRNLKINNNKETSRNKLLNNLSN